MVGWRQWLRSSRACLATVSYPSDAFSSPSPLALPGRERKGGGVAVSASLGSALGRDAVLAASGAAGDSRRAGLWRITRAGTPTATPRSGTLRVTTEPAPV